MRPLSSLILSTSLLAMLATHLPAQTRPASRSAIGATAEQLLQQHLQAVDLVRQEKYAKAQEILDHVYELTPPPLRSRALVLNRAIIDLQQRTFAVRAVRELTEYLVEHKAEDELATNILSGALEVVATDSAKLKPQRIWQAGYKEWDRRNYNLEHSRPGAHRWGSRWMTDEQFKVIQDKQEEVKQKAAEQQAVVRTAAEKFDLLFSQQQNARALQQAYLTYRDNLRDTVRYEGVNAGWDRYAAQFEGKRMRDAAIEVGKLADTFAVPCRDAWADLEKERKKLDEILAQRPKPPWPTHFDPVDPPAPVTAPPSTRPAAATQAAQ